MKLITKANETTLKKYPLYSQDGKGYDATAILKFFSPMGAFTWWVTEARKQDDGDYLFFGLVQNNYFEKEWGYFTLKQLQSIRLPYGLRIERDMYFKPCTLASLQ